MQILIVLMLLISHDVGNQTYSLNLPENLPQTQLQCLIDNAFYEARGEGNTGVLLVTKVVMNRAERDNLTFCEVVYKKNQFSWTRENHEMVLNEDREKLEVLILKLYNGFEKVPEVFEKALYYHNTSVKPYWSSSFKRLGKHKNHIFYEEYRS